jgi:cyclopropane-fatty-acyl-phospholipid synthase
MEPARVAAEVFESPSRAFAVELWDGSVLPPARDEGVRGRVALRHPRVLQALLPPSEHRLSEAFLDGDLDLEGDAIGLLEAAGRWEGPRLRASLLPPAISLLLRRTLARAGEGGFAGAAGAAHSLSRDQAAVRHHYDVSDDFYRLFLDAGMVYSCAYFARGGETLEEAQRAKLELVCRKLALAPGERLLDMGCGWGALVEHAALCHGAEAVGVTLSQNQLATARARLAALPATARASVQAVDYRTLAPGEPFHKAASIGMMEHVGRERLDEYFGAVHGLLAPGGLFLNHAIADASGVETIPWASRREGGFIDQYIFPDGDLVPLPLVAAAAERAGFEVRDVESLREHYAETLAHWLSRLEGRLGEAEALVGRRRARAYRLYLASSAAAFRLGRISVFQLLLARRTATGRVEGLPRDRAAWTRPPLGGGA